MSWKTLDLLERNALSLEDVGIVVLDEVDWHICHGTSRKIIDQCISEPQMILRATLDHEVSKFVKSYQNDPVLEVASKKLVWIV